MSDNLRGSLLMVLAMAMFALEDMFIKLLADTVPVGQVVALLGVGGALVFGAMVRLKGQRLLPPEVMSGAVVLRNLAEVTGGLAFVLAIVLTPLSSASAILQATPLAVTLGAALFFGEKVGWRRWGAILCGFFGVLLIVRPGLEGFEPASLLAVLAVVMLGTRDLATRRVPARVSSWQLSAWAYVVTIPGGLLLLAAAGEAPVVPDGPDALRLGAMLAVGLVAYWALVGAVRTGEVSVVTPFRYSRMLFALVIGIAVFGERPDTLTLVGATIVVCAGLFTIWRETRRRGSQTGQGKL